MNDSNLGHWIALCIASVILSIIWAVALYSMNNNTMKAKAIDKGADPIAVSCAYDNINAAACAILSAKK